MATPASVVSRLARDRIEVARPILEESPLLEDEELIDSLEPPPELPEIVGTFMQFITGCCVVSLRIHLLTEHIYNAI